MGGGVGAGLHRRGADAADDAFFYPFTRVTDAAARLGLANLEADADGDEGDGGGYGAYQPGRDPWEERQKRERRRRGDAVEGEHGASYSVHAVIEGMGAIFHEHHAEIVRWPWKVFCSKWARLIEYEARRQEDEENRKIEAEQTEMQRRAREGF